MKNLLKPKNLPILTVALSGIAFVLRWLLLHLAVDKKGLIQAHHPLTLLLWLVTAAVVGLILAAALGRKGSGEYADNFGPSRLGAGGALALAVGILISALGSGVAHSGLEMARDLLGIPAVMALAALAYLRWKGQKPVFLLHAAVCVFFAVHMVSRYQLWSSNPQIQDYVFSLFACVGLMLLAYQQAAFEAGMGRRRSLLAVGLMTVFACFVAVSGTEDSILYFTGGLWAATALCSLKNGE